MRARVERLDRSWKHIMGVHSEASELIREASNLLERANKLMVNAAFKD